MKGSTRWYDAEQLGRISEVTIAHYDRLAEAYWDGTGDHDVTQNYAALLDAIEGDPPYSILDLGCGPGRDVRYFRSRATTSWVWTDRRSSWPWHAPIRSARFSNRISSPWHYRRAASMASLRMHRCSTCRARSCRGFWRNSPKPCGAGVCFCSNPRGNNEEGLSGDRYSCFFDHDTWRDYVTAAGFFQVRHYYRPPGLPRRKQSWLSTVWRKG